MAKKRLTYTAEFKTEAVKLITDQRYSISKAARSLGLRENLLRNWGIFKQTGKKFHRNWKTTLSSKHL